MLFFRIFQHLLPDALAWRILKRATGWLIGDDHEVGEPGLVIGGTEDGRTIERFFGGLAETKQAAREHVDGVYLDLFPETTRQLALWEEHFGLEAPTLGTDRVKRLDAEWKATGGQSPHYLQSVVRAAGFNLYIHEWWASGPPWVARNPRDYTEDPIVGSVQCNEPLAQCGEPTAFCNNFLANDTHYLVNSNLSPVAPPAVPTDPAMWPYFVYWGGQVFPAHAQVLASRRKELERLLLKLCPTNAWIVLLVNWVDEITVPVGSDEGQLDFSDPDQSALLLQL